MIADDHQMFIDGLTAILKEVTDFNIVDTALNGVEAKTKLENHAVDVLIMDITMPEMDGLKLHTYVKTHFPSVKTLVVTSHSDYHIIHSLSQENVDGFLLKNTDKQELLQAIYTLKEGGTFYSQMVKERVMESIFKSKPSPTDPALSKREKEILRLISKGLTAQEIAEQSFISLNTVNTHKKNLFVKLRVKNVAGLVRYALENGYAN